MKAKHRELLHKNVRSLSDSLTSERGNLRSDYMTDARYLGAYLHYFLPWNLYRLSRLFTGISPHIQDGGVITDLGSGPLTVPLAMWMSMPKLRERKLTFVCVDRAPKVMNEGRKIFEALAGRKCPWKIVTVKGSIGLKLREKSDLVVAANTLNELNWNGKNSDQTGTKLGQFLAGAMKNDARLLLVEPGLRQSAHILSDMRQELMGHGLTPLAPCTHSEGCPMHGQGQSRWCHFNFGVDNAPQWLMSLTHRARLTKTGLSLSFLYMTSENVEHLPHVRAVSEVFNLPEGRGQYGCSARGLTLLQYPQRGPALFPGQFAKAEWPEESRTDLKSGAHILPMKAQLAKK